MDEAGNLVATSGITGKRIVLGVSGGIAAYKAAELTSKLVQRGASVDVVLTDGAQSFIQPLTFNALTRRPVATAVDAPWTPERAGHVTLAAEAELLLIAPATANTLARLATGVVDDMLTAVALATRAPLVIAPAMEHNMWHHPATQHNLDLLRERGVQVIAPESGYLASGAHGDGRLAAIETILAIIDAQWTTRALDSKRIVITAGGTKEAIDPVRYIGNRSSGRMGVALARAAARAGAAVTLIAVSDVAVPEHGFDVVRVQSAREMETAVHAAIPGADVLIMAAAVADFRPVTMAEQKIKKQPGQEGMSIELARNPDIIAGIDQPGLMKVGFAAETEHLLDHATAKLRAKGLALIVANDAVTTIGSTESTATLLFADGTSRVIDRAPKHVVAETIIAAIAGLLEAARA